MENGKWLACYLKTGLLRCNFGSVTALANTIAFSKLMINIMIDWRKFPVELQKQLTVILNVNVI